MKIIKLLAGFLAVAFLAIACSPGVPASEVTAKDQEIAKLKTQVAGLEKDSKYWKQLTAVMTPVTMASMTDHRAYMLPSGVVLATHFDNMDLSKAENLNWVALGIPGKFCKADQSRVEQAYGKGFTHFHDMTNDTHGGKPNAQGVWFVHVAVREFNAPWGAVKSGIDGGFMPTPGPDC